MLSASARAATSLRDKGQARSKKERDGRCELRPSSTPTSRADCTASELHLARGAEDEEVEEEGAIRGDSCTSRPPHTPPREGKGEKEMMRKK